MTAQSSLYGQAQRHLVLLEGATGTWCTYCPGAAMAAHDLQANGDPVAVIKYHDVGTDPFITPESQARISYYGMTSFPTSYFDGQNPYVGGSASTSIYGSYLPRVNSAISVPTPFDIGLTWTQNGNSVNISAEVEQMGTHSGGLVVHIAATESDIQYAWLNQTEVNNALRKMVPHQNGTPLSISQGQTVTINQTLTLDPGWSQNNMEVIAWVQDPASKVVYNTTKVSLEPASGAYDPGLTNIPNAPPAISCMDQIAPQVMVTNYGSDELSSISFSYSVTNGYNFVYSNNYTWNGNLAFQNTATITLPNLSFVPIGQNTLVVNITGATDVNGNSVNDAVSSNNSQATSWEYNRDAGMYTFNLVTDNFGFETYWQLTNSSGSVIASGGNTNVGPNGGGNQMASSGDPGAYGNNVTITENIMLNGGECYDLLIVDDYADGICCGYGNGSYSLTDPNNVLVVQGGQFQATDETDWFAGAPLVSIQDRLDEELMIYPNPNQGSFMVKSPESMVLDAQMTIHALDGRIIYQAPINKMETNVDLNVSAGTYVVKITGSEKVAIKKINIQ